MKLPTLPFGQKKEKPESFLSLVFRSDKIEAFIFEKIGDEMKVASQEEEYLDESLENAKFEDLLEVTDRILSEAEDEAKLEGDVVKTVFGLKETWIEDNKIKKEYLDILKRLCEELGLKPIGFLTISEAIVGLLQKEEGAPPSAILAEVAKNNLTVSLVRAGKVIEVKSSEIHQSAAFTVDTLLKHFQNVEILPSRIVLLNEEEELVQEFVSHPWSKSLPFLHLPQITNLPNGFMGRALVLGIAKQVGAKVMDDFDIPEKKSSFAEASDGPEEKIDHMVEPAGAIGADEEIQDIRNEQNLPPEEPVRNDSNIEYVEKDAQEFFGFVQGKDVNKIKPPEPKAEIINPENEEAITEELPEEVKIESEGRQIMPAGATLILPKLLNSLSVGFESLKKYTARLPVLFQKIPIKDRGILLAGIPVLLILLFLSYYFFLLKATVAITVSPKIVEKQENITFGTNSDFANNTVKGDLITTTEDGSTTVDATGKKQTGDKAKGTVTIFNSSTSTITFPTGTKITSSNGLTFLTLGSVTVASRSADVPPTAGTNNVNVQAEKFGTSYNLPSGTKFPSITGDADIAAKNDNPFSGGTQKDVIVVSKDDYQKARDQLIKQLEDKAKTDLQGKLTPNQEILPTFADESLTKENFDKDLDTEAKNVTLQGTVSYESLSYDKTEFQNYLKSIFGSGVDTKNAELSFENIKVNGSIVTATLKVKAKIFPTLNTDDLSKKIAGKSFTEAQNLIMGTPQIEDVRITFSPNLFFIPKTLPRINKNIQIKILENG